MTARSLQLTTVKRQMKALTFKRYGKTPGIEFSEIPQPPIGPDDLLVEVYAAGLNPVDNMILAGTFKAVLRFTLPATLGSDVAGIVVKTGSAVTRFKVGDEIFASVFDHGTGTLAEYAVVPQSAAAFKPASLSFVQAASIPMVGLTSWQALKERMNLSTGQKIFIPAGSGGIGSFAIQLARHMGAKVATTTSTSNVEWVRNLGAENVIDYTQAKFHNVLSGYDAVLGTVRGDSIEQSLQILKPGGKIVSLVGPLDENFGKDRKLNVILQFIFRLMSRKIKGLGKKRGVSYAFHFLRPDGSQLAQISELLQAGHVTPVIDKVFPFEQAQAALSYLSQGRAKGKVVVRVR